MLKSSVSQDKGLFGSSVFLSNSKIHVCRSKYGPS
jgi:hypothetical protein